ncbi:MAG: carboxymuconolactone decarboxylase family protein [Candidatus Saganbacteria bacterium]|nr:carboxymuconolactone decarboxylase family protein [Candidatus Saganbacteria bacterium]
MVNEGPWYLKQSPLGAGYQHFSNTAKQASILDSKTKELIRVAIASVFRCRHCTEHHIKDALAAGATKQEISETILLSALQAAGTQLNWHKEFFEEKLTDK